MLGNLIMKDQRSKSCVAQYFVFFQGEDITDEPANKKQHLEVSGAGTSPSKESNSPLPKSKESSSALNVSNSEIPFLLSFYRYFFLRIPNLLRISESYFLLIFLHLIRFQE